MDSKRYWVISGDLPSDYTSVDNAKDAKEALRHFAMHWQLKAENLINAKEFGALLINRAENLFAMQNTPDLWV